MSTNSDASHTLNIELWQKYLTLLGENLPTNLPIFYKELHLIYYEPLHRISCVRKNLYYIPGN